VPGLRGTQVRVRARGPGETGRIGGDDRRRHDRRAAGESRGHGHLRHPGRLQSAARGCHPSRRTHPLRSDAPRRDGRFHGLRPRQDDGRDGCVHVHRRTGRHQPRDRSDGRLRRPKPGSGARRPGAGGLSGQRGVSGDRPAGTLPSVHGLRRDHRQSGPGRGADDVGREVRLPDAGRFSAEYADRRTEGEIVDRHARSGQETSQRRSTTARRRDSASRRTRERERQGGDPRRMGNAPSRRTPDRTVREAEGPHRHDVQGEGGGTGDGAAERRSARVYRGEA